MVAADSIWAPVIMHIIINAQSVCSMFLSEMIMPGSLAAESAAMTKENLLVTIGIYSMIAAVTTVLAVCLLIFIADREGQKEQLRNLLQKPEGAKKRITLSLVTALVIAFAYMLLEALLTMVI